ncbi:ABC transporter permease [Clostridium aestuarii]|uniref:ABC transporter permease n=1 Tax=Clostridium aestuarii TaxID=338193 RepID=A0ABT4D1F3_9CLOT|nr:ABC transporter permease [Clostridium aestuarii]MCY6483878.1 ABC transporter permease [Clostridium aestuarii]
MFKDNLKMAWENIINNKMRSFLTMLGIVIGVASIIALITIVKGATDSITDQISSFGANKIIVHIQGTQLKPGLLDRDIKNLEKIDNIIGVSQTLNEKSNIVYNKKVYENVVVQGKNDVYFSQTEDLIKLGRGINILDINGENRVCLIGTDIEKELFYGINPISKKMKIGGVTYTVIGTLQESQGFSLSNNNKAVIIPYTTAMNYFGTRYINSLDVYMEDGEMSDITTKNIESLLKVSFNNKDNAFSVSNMQSMIDSIENMTGMMSMLLGGIAAISLLVGGIGIMNMMLVSVTERTTEIGLRKALGAEPRRIQEQFLIESVVLSLVGGIVGLVVGAILAYLVSILLNNPFTLSYSTVLLAIGFSGGVGIIFGITPARKASRLNPIDALRSV